MHRDHPPDRCHDPLTTLLQSADKVSDALIRDWLLALRGGQAAASGDRASSGGYVQDVIEQR